MKLANLTLELSAKPFIDPGEERMREVAATMFRQYESLAACAAQISVLLWLSDGSEILEYTGELDRNFEWAYWFGLANIPDNENGWKSRPDAPEREKRNLHEFPVKYFPSAGPRPYRWIKRLVYVIKEVGREMTGKPVRVGTIFDIGPEFAVSPFKKDKHPELSRGPIAFIACDLPMHADSGPYAAYPSGVPEGTPFGEFLGKQFRVFARDIGLDYLWLSNGVGFGRSPWGIGGVLFDKHRFFAEKADEAVGAMLRFWREFKKACPDIPVETRGSNFSAGVEIATDAAPLRELYAENLIVPPVNSPWAALDFKSGLEIAAWMTHVAELPDQIFPYRFYAHDPWWLNSPWLDRYGREPWDIYLPLSVGRITAEGKTEGANSVSILTVDDSLGRMPDQVPREIIPHLFDALENAPDSPGPIIWVYPFDEYSELVRGRERFPECVFNEDFFLGETIQSGAPVNTVISTGNFRKLADSGSRVLDASILLVPVTAADGRNLEVLKAFLARGGKAIFYGSLKTASEELLQILHLEKAEPLSGRVRIVSELEGDSFREGSPCDSLEVLEQFDGGGLEAIPASGCEVLAAAWQGEERRVVVSLSCGGQIGFVRALLPCDPNVTQERHFDALPPDHSFPAPVLLRYLLHQFGWSFRSTAFDVKSLLPRLNLSRHDNAFFFSLLTPDTTVEMRVSTPYGAPILNETETYVGNSEALWHPGKCLHKECRVFVRQLESSVIRCKIMYPAFPKYAGRLHCDGFRDAEVRFFLPHGVEKSFEAVGSEKNLTPYGVSPLLSQPLLVPEWEDFPDGSKCALFRHVTGYLYFAW